MSEGQDWLDMTKENFIAKYSEGVWDYHERDFYDPEGQYTMKTYENTMRDKLYNNVCEVDFVKVNGEERKMTCTLMESKIPEDMKPKGKGKIKPSLIAVYDLNAEGWRSFRTENVKRFSVL